jgi:phage-related protein
MLWTVETLNETVDQELAALPADLRARFVRIARALYVTASEQRVIVVRVFVKKTQKTPRREINLALERAREVAP